MNADGSEQIQLTANPADDCQDHRSPDWDVTGEQILARWNYEVSPPFTFTFTYKR
jgi:hypothetical protein